MAFPLRFRYPANSWRGFLLRVAVIAAAALLVLGVADWLGISLDPLHPAQPHPYVEPDAPPSSLQP